MPPPTGKPRQVGACVAGVHERPGDRARFRVDALVVTPRSEVRIGIVQRQWQIADGMDKSLGPFQQGVRAERGLVSTGTALAVDHAGLAGCGFDPRIRGFAHCALRDSTPWPWPS